MSPLSFLAAVLPSSGRYCVFEIPKKRHVFVESLSEIISVAEKLNAKPGANTYFWMASTDNEEAKTRTANDARFVRALWMDLDVGKDEEKSYPSKKAAADAFQRFTTSIGLNELGQPYVTTSGNGYQIFWPLDADTPIADWLPVAENFKLLCAQEGLLIDMTCTADAARVMRVPGTTNYGKPNTPPENYKQAKILVEATNTFSLATLDQLIRSKLAVKTFETKKKEADILSLPGVRPTAAPSAMKLFENSDTFFKEIWKRTKEGKGCAQLAYYVENATADGMEPIWRGLLSIAQKCADGDKAALWLSEQHPYDEDRMQQKLREIKGPYPCLKLDSENPGICTNCPHFGKITNPLALGRKVVVSNEPAEIVVSPAVEKAVEEVAPITVQRPAPPRGFSYGKQGAIFREVKEKDAEGKEITGQSMVLPYSLFVVDILRHEKEHEVHMLATRPEGAFEVIIPQRAVVSKDETTKCLAQQNIVASYGAGNDKHLFDYVRGCVEEASAGRRAVRVPDHYAWQPDGSFVFNERIYAKGASPQHIPMRGLANINHACVPKGQIENWRKVVKMLSLKRNFDILALSLVGFGSPLMKLTGFHGITFHLGSSQSGTGKTLALDLAASVWGDPTKYKVGKSTSDVAMQQRLGMLHGLPLITDEITAKNRKDFEWVAAFIFDMSEGKGKERMESGSNKERENTTYWDAMSLLSSNTHVVDYLTGARSHSSEGELRRVLEIKLTKVLRSEEHTSELQSH